MGIEKEPIDSIVEFALSPIENYLGQLAEQGYDHVEVLVVLLDRARELLDNTIDSIIAKTGDVDIQYKVRNGKLFPGTIIPSTISIAEKDGRNGCESIT